MCYRLSSVTIQLRNWPEESFCNLGRVLVRKSRMLATSNATCSLLYSS